MSDVLIIDSGGANLASLRFAFDRLGAHCEVSADPTRVAAACRVVLPGVGAAADAMARLRAAHLTDCIRQLRSPVLGICLGMQLLFEACEEGNAESLGLLPGKVRRLPAVPGLSVPHMGWNTCQTVRSDPLLKGLTASDYVYFVHSYAVPLSAATSAATEYGESISAAVWRDNFHGVQFHPERSAQAGALILKNFLAL